MAVTQWANQEVFLVAMGKVAIKHVVWPLEGVFIYVRDVTSNGNRPAEIAVAQG